MKKLFISAIALATCLMAMATPQIYVELRLAGSGVSNALVLTEDDAYTSAYESGADVEKIMDQSLSTSVLMYGFVGTTACGEIVTDNIEGLQLGLKTNEVDANYTITFKNLYNISGRTLYLYDLQKNQSTEITNNGTYNFTAPAGQVAINDRFIIGNPSFATSVTTNADGWASFAYTADVAPAYPAGLEVYKGALNTTDPDNMVVDLTAVSAIPAGAGVFVHGAANTTYYFSAAASAPALTGNQIVGCTTATDPAGITKAIYTLRNVGGTTALYQYVGTEAIPAGKAYLPIAISAGAPARIAIRVAQPTDVREVEATVKAEKFMEDGKIYIRRGDNIYNLQGQKVN